ncbi:MAG: hypothetical protein JNM93_03320 [Bacteriovoracaceae bacterium]|nr:hypothetical protein [Bacteriovoracaceae bacterium]
MKLKIKERSPILLNTLVFILFCFLLLHVLTSLVNEVSSFHLSYLKQNVFRFKFIFLTMIISAYSVWFIKKYSANLLALLTTMILFEGLMAISEDFNKLVLFLLFVFSIISYYFYQIWKSELSEPYYNPNYTDTDLFEPMLYRIKVELIIDESIHAGHLTNWQETGAFVYLEQPLTKVNFDQVQLRVNFMQEDFNAQAQICAYSNDMRGFGIKFSQVKETGFSWADFFITSYDMGIDAHHLK